MPDPNARFERVGPVEKEWVVDDQSLSGWVSVPAPEDPSRWVYFWLDGPAPRAQYRCYLETDAPGAWSQLSSPKDVYRTTGFREDDEESDEEGAELGAAARLEVGTYRLDFQYPGKGENVLLEGIRFEVREAATRRPWWKLW